MHKTNTAPSHGESSGAPSAPDMLFVVTGGPGAGKTTLLEAAAASGIATVPETGRAITQLQVEIGGRAVHWDDRATYAELMLDRDIQNHQTYARRGVVALFDRGVPDLVGYARLCGLAGTDHIYRAAQRFRYNRSVFVAPPWRAIYANDAERKQDWAEAVKTYETIAQAYEDLGYRLIELPMAPVAERLALICEVMSIER
ncbi:AAA family ATPase [Pelagibacterium xiamenense]|uniref:AAA family ATPase n=1 Tax=Pelagibacterium xiamenense TaxID=2901140 RepID=UPI001E520B90|nr:AAA family ATPase [Pelagibacterium xiamenense]MCD7059888.1 AAA family ATPase [Pelagibacterium xiamenense]